MTRVMGTLALACLFFTLAGCGSDSKQSQAEQTVKAYWTDIGHGKMKAAYGMLTSGNRQSVKLGDFTQNFYGFLEGTGGVSATVGKANVNDDRATVPVHLHSPKTTQPLNAYQHLFWENGTWRISDENGQLTSKP